MIQAAYVGRPPSRVFTLAHLPAKQTLRNAGVVLCHPIGSEYVTTFRTFRVLATELAANAIAAVRFDYSGTGDSAGEPDEFGLADWRDDIRQVIDHARGALGLDAVALVGMRLGATLALEVAADRDDVTRVVLWEPITDGAEYLEQLRTAQAEWLGEISRMLPGIAHVQADAELLGFHYSERLRDDLEAMRPSHPADPMGARVLMMGERIGTAPSLGRQLREAGADITHRQAEPIRLRGSTVELEAPTVPVDAVREIVSWLADELT